VLLKKKKKEKEKAEVHLIPANLVTGNASPLGKFS
jgi:hypothetical protein